MPLFYRLTKRITKQLALETHCSREFVFAYKLSLYFDELADYIPIFNRLKELAKISVLVRIFKGIRQTNLDALKQIEVSLQKLYTSKSYSLELPQLEQEKALRGLLESGFVAMRFDTGSKEALPKKSCLWTPTAFSHLRRGSNRNNFFCYGGVNLCPPEIKQVQTGNWSSLGILSNGITGAKCCEVFSHFALDQKMNALRHAQGNAVRTEESNGLKYYYAAERAAKTQGSTRGACQVTAWNPHTNEVFQYTECYDHEGRVNRVHPKMVNGVWVPKAPHFPKTKKEVEACNDAANPTMAVQV
jgi:hypothetical protein